MAKKNKYGFWIGIAVALLLPLFAWFWVNLASQGKIKIPKHYGISYIDTIKTPDGSIKYDTIYRAISDVELTNQLGQRIDINRNLRGKMLVINFFSTLDTTPSLAMARNIFNIQKSFHKHPNWVQFLTISATPNRDNVSRIRQWADRLNVKHEHWWVLTGDSTTIYNFASKELSLKLPPADSSNDYAFRQLILVDTFRHIRGYYDGLDTAQIGKLLNDIAVISMEKGEM